MSSSSITTVSFVIHINEVTQINIIPKKKNVVNRFDEHGDLFTLDRIPDEDNISFRNRLYDATVHKGGPTYNGFINNLARELGCNRFHALTIDLLTGSDGIKTARNPRVDILADRIILYENWQDDNIYEIDKEIEFYDIDSPGYYLNNLVAEINSSSNFIASIPSGVRQNSHSANLIRGSSFHRIQDEIIFANEQHKFMFPSVVTGSISFTEKDIFKEEVSVEPTKPGEYMVNYDNNYVVCYDLPSEDGTCAYEYNIFPYKIDASLIRLYSLQDENFVNKLFVQETTNAGVVKGLPNAEGSEIYHQLFKETNVFWGK